MSAPARRLILNFHGLGSPERTLEEGELQTWLPSERYEEILDEVGGRRDIAVTFDDGNRSDIEVALPALRRRGLTATFFVVAGRIGEAGFLTASDITALRDAGMVIGLHGFRHRALRNLEEDLLRQEICEARARIAEIVGEDVHEIACPFGSYDRSVLRRLRDEGYRRVYTSDGGWSNPQGWLQPRNSLRRTDPDDIVQRLLKRPRASTRFSRQAKLALKRWR